MTIQPEYGFVAYIDEAGDPGLKRVQPIDDRGGSEWFILSGVVVSYANEKSVVDWVRDIRNGINATQGPELHFRKLGPTKALAAANAVAKLPLRCFCVASNKQNMRGHR
ncbi:MAG: DUF3800 domain-containing protein, partial [Pseudomonadota bacterium]